MDDGQFPAFLVYIRGFSKSQTYKVNRYQSTFECIWSAKRIGIVDQCREIFFEDGTERLPGNLLDITISHKLNPRKSKELRRNLKFLYNVPIEMSGRIMKKIVSYHIDSP